MKKSFLNPSVYQTGGSLSTDFPTYVERPADIELYQNIKAGNFCYVLAARQMGKSSLRVRAMDKLAKEDNYKCVSIDITSLGSQNTEPSDWFYSFLHNVAKGLQLKTDVNLWWKQKKDFTPVARLLDFFEEIVLNEIYNNIVIFIDEIDSLMGLDKNKFSTDDFFAAIRQLFNMRVDNHAMNRLNFVILGVATPEDLMSDSSRTPFNIGVPIQLDNFSHDAARPLLIGFEHVPIDREALLAEIMNWTNGQPYLSQKLCKSIAESTTFDIDIEQLVFRHVDKLFFASNNFDNDHNISHIDNRIKDETKYNAQMLGQYEQLISLGVLKYNGSTPQIRLKLTGLLIEKFGYLIIANKIYRQRFDHDWLMNALQKLRRPYSDILNEWLLYKKDASQLQLSSEKIEEIHNWSKQKSDLSNLERQFVDAILSDERRTSEAEKQRLRKRGTVTAVLLFVLSIAIVVSVLLAINMSEKRDEAKKYAAELDEKRDIIKASKDSIEQKHLRLQRTTQQLKVEKQTSDSLRIIAIIQGKRNENLYKSLSELTNAQEYEIINPTIALQKAHNAQQIATNEQVENTLYRLYSNNIFYDELQPKTNGQLLSFSPGNDLLLIKNSNQIALYNINTEVSKTLNTDSPVSKAFISANGKFITCCTRNNKAIVFDHKAKKLYSVEIPKDANNRVADISNNGEYLAFASKQNYGILYHLQKDNYKKLVGHNGVINSIRFSEDSKRLITGSSDETAAEWNMKGDMEQRFTEHRSEVVDAVISPNGKYYATASKSGNCIFWKSRSDYVWLKKHTKPATLIRFSPNSQYLISGSRDETAQIWSIEGNNINTLKSGSINFSDISFNKNGTSVYTLSTDNKLREWKLYGIEYMRSEQNQGVINAISFSTDGSYLASGSNDNKLMLWGLKGDLHKEVELNNRIKDLVISPVRKEVYVAVQHEIRKYDFDGKFIGSYSKHNKEIIEIKLSNDGSILLSCALDNKLLMWNTHTGNYRTYHEFDAKIKNIAISANNNYIAASDIDHNIFVFNSKGQTINVFGKEKVNTAFLKFSEPDNYIVTNENENSITYRNIDGTIVKRITFADDFDTPFISKSMKYVLAYTTDKQLKLYDMKGNQLHTIESSYVPVSVSFSGNDEIIAIGYRNGMIMIYKTKPLIEEYFRSQ